MDPEQKLNFRRKINPDLMIIGKLDSEGNISLAWASMCSYHDFILNRQEWKKFLNAILALDSELYEKNWKEEKI